MPVPFSISFTKNTLTVCGKFALANVTIFRILLAGFFMLVFALVSALMMYETHVESVNFSMHDGWMLLRRYRIFSCWAKESLFRLEDIARVHAAKRGFVGRDVD